MSECSFWVYASQVLAFALQLTSRLSFTRLSAACRSITCGSGSGSGSRFSGGNAEACEEEADGCGMSSATT